MEDGYSLWPSSMCRIASPSKIGGRMADCSSSQNPTHTMSIHRANNSYPLRQTFSLVLGIHFQLGYDRRRHASLLIPNLHHSHKCIITKGLLESNKSPPTGRAMWASVHRLIPSTSPSVVPRRLHLGPSFSQTQTADGQG